MRTVPLLLRSGLTVAAVAALPLALTAQTASAAGISVSTSGSTVSVTTSACLTSNGSGFGSASLLNSSQRAFDEGRVVALSGTSTTQSAVWSNVPTGTHTVTVRCANGATAGSQAVIVSTAPTPTSSAPTISATASSPTRGVMGGLGGAAKDYGTLTLAAGGVLVACGAVAAAWVLRRRSKPHRL
ncbi:hypothetical protein [Streptomyces turgidiscabies]|uniref:Secreted protein n=1 Tax=Streptomyces turgidiscabies TaxID=85558 RepID=A0ABU0RU04_9ACTN|nr:hypothetical protein [Streptomyces turgidiscabies]MDQ0935461.1 hypothetical protein [Streptomyces turgidiscabies]